jgi:Bacteriophage tail sheath protein
MGMPQTIADSAFAAGYAPWLVVPDPAGGSDITVPPGGHVLGIYARADTERGVHQAPAKEVVRGSVPSGWCLNQTTSACGHG